MSRQGTPVHNQDNEPVREHDTRHDKNKITDMKPKQKQMSQYYVSHKHLINQI